MDMDRVALKWDICDLGMDGIKKVGLSILETAVLGFSHITVDIVYRK